MSNFNSPTQCVVAGRADAVEVFLSAAEARFFSIGHVIETRICMHVRRFRPTVTSFIPALKAAAWQTPRQSYWPNVMAQPIANAEPRAFCGFLARHVYQPVLWRQTLEAFHALYPDAVFVEVGPLQVLSRMMGRRWFGQGRVFALDPMEQAGPPSRQTTLEAIHDAVAA